MTLPSPRDLLDLTGSVVIVTGAGQGLGAGIARRFAEAGAAVAVNYRSSAEGARQVAAEIEAGGGRAVALAADVTSPEAVAGLVAATVESLGGLDALINNAGIYPISTLVEMPVEEWRAVVDANLSSVHIATQAAARHWIDRGLAGSVVNIASIEGEAPAPGHSHYNAAKAGVLMHTRTAAQELGAHGIRVNSVSPGLIWREGIEQAWPDGVERWLSSAPLGRLGHCEDVADACIFLASPAARWITGSNLLVDGGMMASPIF